MPGRTSATARAGVVSIVTVIRRGAEDSTACLSAISELQWPDDRIEVICVDNASGSLHVEKMRRAAPDVVVVESPVDSGLAGGCNLGVAHATGEYIAVIRNDARPDPRWLAAAVGVLERDPTVGAVASKVLGPDAHRVRYVDGCLTWFGMGTQPEAGRQDRGQWDDEKDVLFASGVAMVVRADLYRELGGFDERYFEFGEDVDFGWRVNLLGHRVRYVPTSVVHHSGIGRGQDTSPWGERYLLERNALYSLYKNLGAATLAKVLAPAMALAVRRCISLGGADSTALDPQRPISLIDRDRVEVPSLSLAATYAIDAFVENLSSLDETRHQMQAKRARTDLELLPLFRVPLTPLEDTDRYRTGFSAIVAAFNIPDAFAPEVPTPPAPVVDRDRDASSSSARFLEAYRAAAAERAVRSTQLRLRLHDAIMQSEHAEEKLERARDANAELRQRLHWVESELAASRNASTKAVRKNAQLRRGVRLARRAVRRLNGRKAGVRRMRGAR